MRKHYGRKCLAVGIITPYTLWYIGGFNKLFHYFATAIKDDIFGTNTCVLKCRLILRLNSAQRVAGQLGIHMFPIGSRKHERYVYTSCSQWLCRSCHSVFGFEACQYYYRATGVLDIYLDFFLFEKGSDLMEHMPRCPVVNPHLHLPMLA